MARSTITKIYMFYEMCYKKKYATYSSLPACDAVSLGDVLKDHCVSFTRIKQSQAILENAGDH